MSTLLIVDRDGALRSEAAGFLTSLGHAVQQARDCAEALQLAGEQDFDLVLAQAAEGGLPELLRAVRKRNPGAALIVQAEAGAEVGEALAEEAPALLSRPYSLPELNFQVRRALEARRRASSGLVERYRTCTARTASSGRAPGSRRSSRSWSAWRAPTPA